MAAQKSKVSSFIYVIQRGDTLLKIANRFGTTVADIMNANTGTIKNPDKIKAGSEIYIPGSQPSEHEEIGKAFYECVSEVKNLPSYATLLQAVKEKGLQ